MEPKRELASLDIASITRELGSTKGAFFDKAYSYPEEELFRFRLRHHDQGRVELVAQIGDIKRLHRADPSTIPEAPKRPPNFAKMLRNRLEHGRLASIEQVGFDRIVDLGFDIPDGTVSVIIELFGDGNVVVIGTDGAIVDCIHEVRLRSRTIRPGGTYTPPEQEIDPFDLDLETFTAVMRASDTDVVRTLATSMNLGGRYAREVCTRAEVDKTLDIADVDDSTLETLHTVLVQICEQIEERSFDPQVYADEAGVIDVTPLPLLELREFETTSYETFSEALDAYFQALPERATSSEPAQSKDDERARLERIRDHQQEAIDDLADEAEALREQAELLYANYDAVDALITVVREARDEGHDWESIEERFRRGANEGIEEASLLERVQPADGAIVITLDDHSITVEVDESLEHNADRLYREAKETEEKREGAIEALSDTESSIEALETAPETTHAPEVEKATDWLDRSSIPIKKPEHWYERFRWFHTSDGFLVIGGRDAKQNEELINKYTESVDRVLHSQAHGGPITIIKASAPDERTVEVDFPESTINEAAQFAVSYSSVWSDGHFTGDVYEVAPEQMTKEATSGEYLSTGAFAVKGERTYHRDVPVGLAIGVMCEPETRLIGGPPAAIVDRTVTYFVLEPGRYAPSDLAKRIYHRLRESFADQRFVREVAQTEEIQAFLPSGGSRIIEDE